MKKCISVCGLFVRSSLWRVLAILGIMAVIQTVAFGYHVYNYNNTGQIWFEGMIEGCHLDWSLAAAFLLITAQLSIVGCAFSSRTDYTVSRLPVSERTVFFCQWAVNSGFFLLLWAVETVLTAGFALWYTMVMPEGTFSSQAIYLAYYRTPLLHGLLPLAQSSTYIRNIFLVLGLGAASAVFPYRQRRKGKSLEVIVLAGFTCFFFSRTLSTSTADLFMAVLSRALIFITLSSVLVSEEVSEE